MPENEKKDGQIPEAVPAKSDAHELDDKNLENVAGGMAASVPHVDTASSLSSLATPVCLSQT